MRQHSEIIKDAGGYRALAEKIGQPISRVRFWERRGSIPAAAWAVIAEKRIAGLRELAAAARGGRNE